MEPVRGDDRAQDGKDKRAEGDGGDYWQDKEAGGGTRVCGGRKHQAPKTRRCCGGRETTSDKARREGYNAIGYFCQLTQEQRD